MRPFIAPANRKPATIEEAAAALAAERNVFGDEPYAVNHNDRFLAPYVVAGDTSVAYDEETIAAMSLRSAKGDERIAAATVAVFRANRLPPEAWHANFEAFYSSAAELMAERGITDWSSLAQDAEVRFEIMRRSTTAEMLTGRFEMAFRVVYRTFLQTMFCTERPWSAPNEDDVGVSDLPPEAIEALDETIHEFAEGQVHRACGMVLDAWGHDGWRRVADRLTVESFIAQARVVRAGY